jgi:hypothetical protein
MGKQQGMLKRHQNLIDEAFILILETPSSSWLKPITPTSYTNPSLDSKPSGNDGEKSVIKLEMLQSHSKNMATMASCFSTTF